MKIAAVQLRAVVGDVAANLERHRVFVERAAREGAELVFFPELSLTGYVRHGAAALASEPDDPRLAPLQAASDAHGLHIGVGLPLAKGPALHIGMVWLAPGARRRAYAKQLLHADEEPFYAPGEGQLLLEAAGHRLAPAICYESLQPEHVREAVRLGADVYLASVAEPAHALEKALAHHPAIARAHELMVVMADGVGPGEDLVSCGHTAAWGRRGELLARLDGASEGLLLVDTSTGEATTRPAPPS